MTEQRESSGSGAEKRRSTRVLHAAPITVTGTDTLGREFRESTKTIMVNCYGCLYQGIRYPLPNSSIMLEVRHPNQRRQPRVVPARVIWVQRPQRYRTLYHVGIEFEVPGNVWDMALPPEDWFTCPEDEELVVPVSAEERISNPNQFVLQASVAELDKGVISGGMGGATVGTGAAVRATQTLLVSEESQMAALKDASLPVSAVDNSAPIMEMVKMFTAEAVAAEIVRLREFIDAELSQAIDRAMNRLTSRLEPVAPVREISPECAASPDEITQSNASAAGADEPSFRNLEEDSQVVADMSRLNARQRRAAKRARKTQKVSQ